VRWLVALLDGEVLDWGYAGLKAGRRTRGHRSLGAGAGDIASPAAYVATLRELFVIVDQDERQALVAARAREVAATVSARPRLDPDLLTENSFLVEYPTCVLGGFPDQYLALPEKVPVTVMEKHQRYFVVEDHHGRLLPYFVITRNGSDEGNDLVRRGNEKVIVPRLEDAEFYLSEDLKTPLPERLEALKRVTYMESLGSLYDKTQRVEAWVAWLSERLPTLSTADKAAAARAATLSKCDQVTLMVGDGKLAALQGYIGGHYARLAGEPEDVAAALAEQYLPVRQDDPLPATAPGRLLAVADRFDNLCAAFSLGLVPKGTRDPQGLRRQTQGLIAILLEAGYRFDLSEALAFGVGQVPAAQPAPRGALPPAEARQALLGFFGTRAEAILQDEGLGYDVIRAALGSAWTDVVDVVERGRALGAVRRSATDFEARVDTATRPANIWRTANLPEDAQVSEGLFADPTEGALWTAYRAVCSRVGELKQAAPVDYMAVWAALGELQQPIAALFDTVMVNAEDAALRRNRLAMMRELDRLHLELADFREIVQ
jgi:glycyl-tRNA synthetase beta chain